MRVNLRSDEIASGALVGIMRQIENLKHGSKPRYGAGNKLDWQKHIEGALGEMALAKHLGVYWSKGSVGDSDVGPFQCRASPYPNADLRLHPGDADDKWFYHVVGIKGRLRAKDGKKDEFWGELPGQPGRPAFWVPANLLEPL